MKKILCFVLLLTLLLSASACSKTEQDGGLSVVCTIFPPYDFAKNVGGGHINLSQLLPAGAESHSYEPTPMDITTIAACDLFIYVGGENDFWVEDILSSFGEDAPKTLTLLSCVEVKEELVTEGMETEEHEHEEHEHGEEVEYDDHVWTDPANAVKIVRRIQEELPELDPDNAGDYLASAAAYIEKLNQLDSDYKQLMTEAVRTTIVVGDRFPFRYMADAYGIEYFAAFPGCSSETEPSARTLAFLIDKVREESLPVVFYIEFSNHLVADEIAAETGAKTLLLHSCHNLSAAEQAEGKDYLSLMESNLEALREALCQ